MRCPKFRWTLRGVSISAHVYSCTLTHSRRRWLRIHRHPTNFSELLHNKLFTAVTMHDIYFDKSECIPCVHIHYNACNAFTTVEAHDTHGADCYYRQCIRMALLFSKIRGSASEGRCYAYGGSSPWLRFQRRCVIALTLKLTHGMHDQASIRLLTCHRMMKSTLLISEFRRHSSIVSRDFQPVNIMSDKTSRPSK